MGAERRVVEEGPRTSARAYGGRRRLGRRPYSAEESSTGPPDGVGAGRGRGAPDVVPDPRIARP
ncbi:hypothetical protein LV779_31720 [Streptomyces thinghirensis]|nr:hypothetical protein [Streptomyces thinghirensis]